MKCAKLLPGAPTSPSAPRLNRQPRRNAPRCPSSLSKGAMDLSLDSRDRSLRTMRLRFPEFIESLGPKTLPQFVIMGPEFRAQMQRQRDIRRIFRVHILGEA
jgi:hypothetical protein